MAAEPELRFENARNYIHCDSLFVCFGGARSSCFSRGGSPGGAYLSGRGEEPYFPEILINGKRCSSYCRREQALFSHDDYWQGHPYSILTLAEGHRSVRFVSYRIAAPLAVYIHRGEKLTIDQLAEDCCNLRLLAVPVAPIESPER